MLGQRADGEAFVDFQVAIKELSQRGIVLAVSSKNDPEVARRPFLEHPDMVLKLDDFAAFVANWEPKSAEHRSDRRDARPRARRLTFLDDNPYERAEVRRALPEVDVPVLPDEPVGYPRHARGLRELRAGELHRRRPGARRAVPGARQGRGAAGAPPGSLEEYQASLDMVARIGPIDAVNLARVVQLINKTNQFNLTTRRRNQAELEAFLARPEAEGFWVRLADKFADHGLIAVALAEAGGRGAGDRHAADELPGARPRRRGADPRRAGARGRRRGVALGSRASTFRASATAMVADLYSRLGMAEAARGPTAGRLGGGAGRDRGRTRLDHGRALTTRWSADVRPRAAPDQHLPHHLRRRGDRAHARDDRRRRRRPGIRSATSG